jgi:ferric-dicitrate binding protein FerR (iron transport regulator)
MLLLTTGLALGLGTLTVPPVNQQRVRSGELPMAPREIVAARGKRATVTLDDGSRVVLGPESRLVILPDFGRTSRTVQLDGWAEFAVRKDTMPFIVKARNSETRVVGTRFVVQARASDHEVRVIVAEGRVESRAVAHSPAVLRPGQRWTLARDGRSGVQDHVSLDRYFGWTEGRLAFDAVPLPEVLAEVARWYDIDLRLDVAALRSRHVTATLPGESLAEALALLGRTLDVRIEQEGNLVRLLPAKR